MPKSESSVTDWLSSLDAEKLGPIKARLSAQFDHMTRRDIGPALDHIQPGPQTVLQLLEFIVSANREHGIYLSIGQFVIKSENEYGYWCNGFGWVADPIAATGYNSMNPLAGFPDDAHYVEHRHACPVKTPWLA